MTKNPKNKGGNFERKMAKVLSHWWTYGARDDVFWRTASSGGRATQRTKFGRDTVFSFGDLGLLDPVGEPFLKMFTVEFKRGYNKELDLLAILDKPDKQHILVKWWLKISEEARNAKNWPLLILCRDRCSPIVCMSYAAFHDLHDWVGFSPAIPYCTISGDMPVLIPLNFFLLWITPEVVKERVNANAESRKAAKRKRSSGSTVSPAESIPN